MVCIDCDFACRASWSSQHPSVGQGLAIPYGIVKMHHDAIAVRSRQGAGSTFTISLPLTLARADAVAGAPLLLS